MKLSVTYVLCRFRNLINFKQFGRFFFLKSEQSVPGAEAKFFAKRYKKFCIFPRVHTCTESTRVCARVLLVKLFLTARAPPRNMFVKAAGPPPPHCRRLALLNRF